ncbi:MAG TPA: amino acid adenylation domain-containing protein, partial [Terriglobales bacterium]|nr:amino acid adenylation domain-containing protein [Terriglobales bacterium]
MEKASTAGFWLSPQQKRVWWLQSGKVPLNAVCALSLEGPLEPEGLRLALKKAVVRHEILRTVFLRQPGMKVPFQVIRENLEPRWQALDIRALDPERQAAKMDEIFAGEQGSIFALESGPIVRATLAQLASARWALVLSLPALCGDFRSLENLVREIGLLYGGDNSALNPEPLRYVQFAQWQSDFVEASDEAAEKAREYWTKQKSAGNTTLALPGERGTTAPHTFQPDSVPVTAREPLGEKIRAVASKYAVTESVVLLSAWQATLWRLDGQGNFTIGVYFDGREYEELQDALGIVGRTLPVPARLEGDVRFSEVLETLGSVRKQHVEWQEHFVSDDEEFAAQFLYQELPSPMAARGVVFRMERATAPLEPYGLKLEVVGDKGGVRLRMYYDAARLERAAVVRMAGYYQALLEAAVAAPETPVGRLPLVAEGERQQLLVEWNQTSAAYPAERCLHELFEAQAGRTPERTALVSGTQALTYGEWNRQANRLAHYLRTLGVGPDSLVGLCLERSAPMMVALLAVLKAGGAYVPLNPDNPRPRLAQQLSGAVALITESRLLGQMPEFAGAKLCLDGDEKLWATQAVSNPDLRTTPENLVYVIYTSGSTGVPKGVAVRHRNLVNYSHFITRLLELHQYAAGLQFATVSTLGADLGNTSIYPAMISGGCLHVIAYDTATDAGRLAAYTRAHPIDVLKIVPSHLEALLDSSEARQILPRRYLIMGGETLTPALVEKVQSLSPGCEIFNHYGPTETTVGSLTLRLKDYDWKGNAGIPIGRPISNTQVYILDGEQQPVPEGVAGELYIAGAGVTAGYLNQPEKTEERFLRNPFVADAEARMYRTGDRARYGAGGNVEFLGRGDDQVKIRGFRIELGEIEAILAQHAGVKQAVVVAKTDARGEKRLLAYVVAREAALTGEGLRSYLKEQLPEYMVPQAVVLLTRLPLTPNGKIDRQALPEPDEAPGKAYVAPANSTEEAMAAIWSEVLRRERISTHDNFFDLGGHSLMATQVVSRIR